MIPIASTSSVGFLIPAVSIKWIGKPCNKILPSTISLVVPSIFVTIALSSFKKAFNKLLFPTFGLPTIAILIPSLIIFPISASFKISLILSWTLSNKGFNYHKIIVDQFTTPRSYFSYLKQENITDKVTKITFLTKGESKHLSVAAASVISRYLFLIEMDKLSSKYNTTILKGASDKVDEVGKMIVSKYGKSELNKIAKTNFKNTEKILNN